MSVQVFVRHIRAANLCTRGTRAWFKQNGLDYNRFLAEGLPEEDFINTGDDLAMRPVEKARSEAARVASEDQSGQA